MLDQLAKKDADNWSAIKNSVVTLLREGIPSGQAALIDKSGLFLAHQDVVFTATTKARMGNGKLVILDWKASDPSTQTVLLQAENWQAEFEPVHIHEGAVAGENRPVLVVLPGGPVRGEVGANSRTAVLASKRMFALGEVRIEATAQNVGGGLVFDEEGHLLGLLNATESISSAGSPMITRFAAPKKDVQQNALQRTLPTQGFGPAGMLVGYTVQSDVLRRVVTGFLSPSHQVKHPAIGVFCKDAPGSGSLVMRVVPNSPADKAGMQPGDIIVKMDETVINDQFDFARFIDTKDVGDKVRVTVTRNLQRFNLNVSVGVYQ